MAAGGRGGDALATRVALEEAHALLELADLLRLDVLVHALALEAASAAALACAVALRSSGSGGRLASRPDHEVEELGQHRARQRVNLELNLFGTLKGV